MDNTNGWARSLADGCGCGAVAHAADDAFGYALDCHRSNRRRTTGSAFKPLAGIERERLRLTSGDDEVMRVGSDDAHDTHCARCGSLLYSVVSDGRFVHVVMGTLIDDPSIRPSMHIFVASKAPWYTITDTLPQHAEHA